MTMLRCIIAVRSVALARPTAPTNALHRAPVLQSRRAPSVRWNGSAASPLGLKNPVDTGELSPNTKLILGYITFGVATMGMIARAKMGEEDVEESARVYNMAKRAVVKDRRFFEAIGYPKEFEKVEDVALDEHADKQIDSSAGGSKKVYAGSFRVIGDKATAIVSYRHQSPEVDASDEAGLSSSGDVPMFDSLGVQLEDGSVFSALESYVANEGVARQQKSTALGKKLFLPVIGGVLIGGVCSFLVIRIIRNRPFYVHKLVLDHVNNSAAARRYLGHPIKSNRKEYVGSLTDAAANYTVACQGSKGEGTLIVKAYKKEASDSTSTPHSSVMATPGTDWKFSTLVLSIKRNEKRKEKAKTAKTIDLLAEQPMDPPTSS